VKALGAAVLVLLAMGGEVSGHQLDEYLQATRVSIARDRVTLEVDLTAGVTIAPAIIETLDANADNIFVPSEAGAYGRAVLSDVMVTFDGHPVVMALTQIDVPTIDEMRHGMGTIHLRAVGGVEARAGRHRLDVVNGHRRDTSVYMVNALIPDDGGVDIVSQSRDAHQREFHLEAEVRPRWATLLWFAMGGAGAMVLTLVHGKTKNERQKGKIQFA
jgi:hypothetical protein